MNTRDNLGKDLKFIKVLHLNEDVNEAVVARRGSSLAPLSVGFYTNLVVAQASSQQALDLAHFLEALCHYRCSELAAAQDLVP